MGSVSLWDTEMDAYRFGKVYLLLTLADQVNDHLISGVIVMDRIQQKSSRAVVAIEFSLPGPMTSDSFIINDDLILYPRYNALCLSSFFCLQCAVNNKQVHPQVQCLSLYLVLIIFIILLCVKNDKA
jgi:hypothetical protein